MFVFPNFLEILPKINLINFSDTQSILATSLFVLPTPDKASTRISKSDNKLFREKIGWEPFKLLIDGLKETYNWVDHQVKNNTN